MSRIVVGVDPSPSGAAALDWALREAVATGSSLQAIQAWMPGPYALEAIVYAGPDADPVGAAQAQLEADEQLKAARDRVPEAAAVSCTATALLGAAAQVVVE